MTVQIGATMMVSLNGEYVAVDRMTTLAHLLQQQGYTSEQRIASAINRQFVPKTQYTTTLLNDGDCIDVVAPIQGG